MGSFCSFNKFLLPCTCSVTFYCHVTFYSFCCHALIQSLQQLAQNSRLPNPHLNRVQRAVLQQNSPQRFCIQRSPRLPASSAREAKRPTAAPRNCRNPNIQVSQFSSSLSNRCRIGDSSGDPPLACRIPIPDRWYPAGSDIRQGSADVPQCDSRQWASVNCPCRHR